MQLSNQTIIDSGLETLLSFYNFDKATYTKVVELINEGLDVNAVIDAARKYTHLPLDRENSTYSQDHMEAYNRLNLVTA